MSPFEHPEKEALSLLERYGSRGKALEFACWVLVTLVEKKATELYWEKVIEILKNA